MKDYPPIILTDDSILFAYYSQQDNYHKLVTNASIIANNRVVFNVKGNNHRLIVHIRYDISIVFIRFIGVTSQ
jgi:mRNA interferase HigB